MIRFEEVSKIYTENQIGLHNLNLQINAGELTFITGHSGAGKTTLFKLIAMLEQPTKGNIYLNKICLGRLKKSDIPKLRRQMGVILQNPHLLDNQSILTNVSLPLIVTGTRRQEATKRSQAALDKLGLLHKQYALPWELSAGEQQRAGIARAIVTRPAIVLADEPTGNLDPALSAEIMHVLEAFQNVGTTVLIATHDLSLVASMGHRMITLQKGEVLLNG